MGMINLQMPKGLPFSKAIVQDCKYQMEISGQIGLDDDGKLVDGIEAQTKQTFENVKKVLAEIGWDESNLTKVRIFLTNIDDYQKVNEIYSGFFDGAYPTRVAVAVKDLPLGALVEFDCNAVGDKIIEE